MAKMRFFIFFFLISEFALGYAKPNSFSFGVHQTMISQRSGFSSFTQMSPLGFTGIYRFTNFYFQAGFDSGPTTWGSLRASERPDTIAISSNPAEIDGTSEINRPRDANNKWSMNQLKVGIGFTGFLYDRNPKLSERVSVSILPSTLKDEANNITFRGNLLSFEAGMAYAVDAQSSFVGSVNHTSGGVSKGGIYDDLSRLPINYLQLVLGYEYCF